MTSGQQKNFDLFLFVRGIVEHDLYILRSTIIYDTAGTVRAKGSSTDMSRLTTGILSEKYIVRRFRCCANVIDCTYTNLDSTFILCI